MTNVVIFTPKHELEHRKNLTDFMTFCKELEPLNDKYDYESNYWPSVGNFTNFGVSNQDRNPENLLDESLLPFAKAYITYEKSSKAGTTAKFYALKAINAACMQQYGSVEVVKLSSRDFDLAAQIARESIGQGAAYQTGSGLKKLLLFLQNKKMMTRFSWKNPNKKPRDVAVGDEADKRRQEKMPDENAIQALAQISSSKSVDMSPRDIFTVSTMALMLSAPARGSEPLYLTTDCLHFEKMKANKAMNMGLSKEDVEALLDNRKGDTPITFEDEITLTGLKWYSGKSYGYENKWLPTVMVETVKVAIERLEKQSREARNFAKMLEDSTDFPRHRLCPRVECDELLTMDEVALSLGLDISIYKTKQQKSTGRNQLLKLNGIERKNYQVSLNDLNKIVRANLPEGFPHIPFKNGEGRVRVKWSDSLYAGFKNNLDVKKATIFTQLSIPTINTLNEDLSPTKKRNRSTGELASGNLSIFQRWGYKELSLTSHQLRHMLDTMAAVNGMENKTRAKWAQRSDPRHNQYYNHTTYEEYGADFIEEREKELAISDSSSKNQIIVQVANPRTIQELNTKASLTAHTTEFGMCITSYLSEPCTKYRDCINCNEQVCVKGDDGKCDRIRDRLAKELKLLKQDKQAVDNNVPGAEQWYQRRKITTERCAQILKMMEDPNIEKGALIKLSNVEDVTQLDRAMDANGKKRLPDIINYKRIKASNVDELIGEKINEESLNVLEELDDFDDL